MRTLWDELQFKSSLGQLTLNKLSHPKKHSQKRKKKDWEKMICFPCMCALFMLNDLYKHNWQAEKKNRMTGQEWNHKRQEIKCWICVALGSEWAIFIWHTVLGGPNKPLQFPGGVPDGHWGPWFSYVRTFHDDTTCRQSRPRCPPQNCWHLREGRTWRWQLQLWTAWTPAPCCPVEGGNMEQHP